MILELRFDQLRPRQVPSYTERWRAALPQRQTLSPLMGLWRTEVGDIDQIVHLWAYDDMAQRDRVEGEAAALPDWNDLQCRAQVQRQSNLLVAPAPFSPALAERALGTIYELRIYQYDAGTIPNVIERWQEKVQARQRLSPLCYAAIRFPVPGTSGYICGPITTPSNACRSAPRPCAPARGRRRPPTAWSISATCC